MFLDGFRQLVYQPDDVLMMSRKHCHARNVHSIVLMNQEGRLSRLFIADVGHDLKRNRPENLFPAVGPHDHRYAVLIERAWGVINHYRLRVAGTGWDFCEYRVKSGVVSGRAEFACIGNVKLELISAKLLSDELRDDVYVRSDEIHTMSVGSEMAAWLVREYQQEKEVTRLFAADPPTGLDGLYKPFDSPQEVVTYVAWFMRRFAQAMDGDGHG